MDEASIIDILSKISDPEAKVRESADLQLSALQKTIGFCPKLLELVQHPQLRPEFDCLIRRTAMIYLENIITKHWKAKHLIVKQSGIADPSQFIIHQQDKKLITDCIVDAIVRCKDEHISVSLLNTVQFIIKSDFPHKWPEVVDRINFHLTRPDDPNAWSGALQTFHQLIKTYEHRNKRHVRQLLKALIILLHTSCQLLTQLLQNDQLSEQSCKLQKQILKIFHASLQDHLPLAIVSHEPLAQWMAPIIEITIRDVPAGDRQNLVWWKGKKWSLRVLARIFERYVSLFSDQKEYNDFAQWYINTFSFQVLQAVIKILDQYASGQYVPPCVMQQAMNYLDITVRHPMTEDIVYADLMVIVEKIIFPLMRDASPVSASKSLLRAICKKEADVLQKTLAFVIEVLNNPQPDSKAINGVLHMVGSIADILINDSLFGNQMEQFIADYLFVQFSCPEEYVRARACWTLNRFLRVKFTNIAHLIAAAQGTLLCITVDVHSPVKTRAVVCLHNLLFLRSASRKVVKPHLGVLVRELIHLQVSKSDKNIMRLLKKLVSLFNEDMNAIAVDLTKNLARRFIEDHRAASDILSSMRTVVIMMTDQKDVNAKLEPVVVDVISGIFERGIRELYKSALTLLSTLNANTVGEETWRLFKILCAVLKRDGFEYLTDMMSPFHHYVTVDPDRFIASEQNLMELYNICRTILNDESCSAEIKCYAAKLLEIIILQFADEINSSQELAYLFFEIAINKLQDESLSVQLKTLLMHIAMSIINYNPNLTDHAKEHFIKWTNSTGYTSNTIMVGSHHMQFIRTIIDCESDQAVHLLESFVEQWLMRVDELTGVHDRKIAVIHLSGLLSLDNDKKPLSIAEKIGPSRILMTIVPLLERLKISYKKIGEDLRANKDDNRFIYDPDDGPASSDDEDEDDDEYEFDYSDDDDISVSDEEEDEEANIEVDLYDDDCQPTALESFETKIETKKHFEDEFQYASQTLEIAAYDNLEWYHKIWKPLTEAQKRRYLRAIRNDVEGLMWPGING